MLVSAVYFSAGFCMITVAERLFTRGSGVEVASFARAIVGGLIVAKVLLLVDLVPFVNAFPHKPLIHNNPVGIPRRCVAGLLRQNLGS